MKPLVSGPEAKRYVEPLTDTYLLFPYEVDERSARLLSASEMAGRYPKAWAYLCSWKDELRARENGKFDDAKWYRFGRHQNLDKQEIEKLVVPRLVTSIGCSVDHSGVVYLDNVDVGGVSVASDVSPFYLAGCLNSPVADFVFRRISKPFSGDYRSANKQFISPLPIPNTTGEERSQVAFRAEALQALHTRRRDALTEIDRRRSVLHTRTRHIRWLFPDLPTVQDFENAAPESMDSEARASFASKRYQEALNGRFEAVGATLRPGVSMSAEFEGGELRFFIDGAPVIDRIFLDEDEGRFILAQWKLTAATFSVTQSTTGKKLADTLRTIGTTENLAVKTQFIELQQELEALEGEIGEREREINALLYRLYDLDEREIRLIERDRSS
jgi:hypothetical protein